MRNKLIQTLLISLLLLSCSGSNQRILIVKDAVVDLSGYDFKDGLKLQIVGELNYYPDQLLSIEQINSGEYHYTSVKFPAKLSEQLPNKDAKGFGTYHFKLKLPADQQSYGLLVEGIFSSYKLFVGSKLQFELGKVGTNEYAQKPMVRPEIIDLNIEEGFNDIVLQVANFHENETQINFPMVIGSTSALHKKRLMMYAYDFSFSFLYVILFAISLILFLFYKKYRFLFFAFNCIVLAYRFLIKNSKPLLEMVDSNWEFFYKSEFITYYFTSSLIPIILCMVFSVPRIRVVNGSIMAIAIFAFLFTSFSDIVFYTPYVYLYHYYSILLVLFTLFITVNFHLLRAGTKHVLLIIGILFYSGCFLYDLIMSLIYYKESFYYNWGLAILCISMAITFIRIQYFESDKRTVKKNKR